MLADGAWDWHASCLPCKGPGAMHAAHAWRHGAAQHGAARPVCLSVCYTHKEQMNATGPAVVLQP